MGVVEPEVLPTRRSRERRPITFLPEPEQQPIFCPFVSTDDHALEPLDLFVARVPERFRDSVPYVEFDAEQVPFWIAGDKRGQVSMIDGFVGRPLAELSYQACKLDEFRRGVWDPKARLDDMDLIGVWASLCFPSTVFGFAATVISKLPDPQAGLAALQAYNRWHIEEWCAAAPDRYIPCQIAWLPDPEIAAQEIRRNAAAGFKCVSFSENPQNLGFASLHSGEWDPFFAACAETGTIINLHVGSSGQTTVPSPDTPAEVPMTLFPLNGMAALSDWVYSRIPLKFPEIRIVLSEAGVAWVPMMLDKIARAHRFVDASFVWTRADPTPAEVIRRNFRFTSIEDPSIWPSLDLVGDDVVMLESDYPHQDSTWPDTQAIIRDQLESLDAAVIKKVCYENACDLYRHPLPPAERIAASEVGQRTLVAS